MIPFSKTLYYIFEQNGHYYYYNCSKNLIVEVSCEFFRAVYKFRANMSLSVDEQKLIEELKKADLIDAAIPGDWDTYLTGNCTTAYLSFAPTYKCNYRCTYCFGDHGDKYQGEQRAFDSDSLKKTLDYFYFKAYPFAKNYRIDFVSGGEPLLGIEMIKEAVAYVEQINEKHGKKTSIWLCTNGSLLTPDLFAYLSSHNISIGISLDGEKEEHDFHRRDSHGNGTYDLIVSNIKKLREQFGSGQLRNLWGLSVATTDNCDFVKIIKHHKRMGFQNIQIKVVRSKNGWDIDNLTQRYRALAEFLFESFCQDNLEYLLMILNDNDQFGKVLKRVLLNQLVFTRCLAGKNKMSICPDGSIYPCDSFVGNADYSIGHIDGNQEKPNAFVSKNVINISNCNICDVNLLCGGDCYYNSMLNTGTPFSQDDAFCQVQRQIIEDCIVLRYKMELFDEKRYNNMLKRVAIKDEYSKVYG